MKDILGPAGRRALEELARSKVLLGFDYDGTLAPIVTSPERAALPRSTRALLSKLSKRYPCAVVSGRARGDVLRFLGALPIRGVVGNHGSEWQRAPRGVPRRTIVRWRRLLARACEGIEGARIEDKTWSLAVHWRASRRKRAARDRILAAAAAIEGARIVPGKDVVNLVHPRAANKGAAILELRRRLACETILYAGDDVTDEDVFALDEPGRLLSVRIGRSRGSHAPFFLADQARIDELLARLIALRPRTRRAPRA